MRLQTDIASSAVKDGLISADFAPVFDRLIKFVESGDKLPDVEFIRWRQTKYLKHDNRHKWYIAMSDPEDAAAVAIDVSLMQLTYEGKVERILERVKK